MITLRGILTRSIRKVIIKANTELHLFKLNRIQRKTNKYSRLLSNSKSRQKVNPSRIKVSKSTSNLSKLGSTWKVKSSSKENRVHQTEASDNKIKWYEMAREMILDGGLVPKNLDKNYIVPEKKNMSRSNSRKRWVKPSPPKFVPRHNQYSNMKKREALLEKQIKEQKVLDECTFSPNIDKNQNHRFVRDADQFYRDQQEFQIKKIEKICQLDKEILEREGTEYRPFLSKVSEEIAMKRDLKEKNIHKRLYNESNNKKIKEGIDVLLSMKKNAKSKKETNVHKGARTSRIEEYLYNDAVIRQRSK